jgi:hypothetical protein
MMIPESSVHMPRDKNGPVVAKRAGREHFGAFAENDAEGLMIRHDHGSQYMANDF